MVLVEHIADRYSWNNQPRVRVKKEASSIYLETKHLPETYDQLITPYSLLEQETGLPVKSFMEKETPLGKIEYDAFESIEQWAMKNGLENRTGLTGLWISPPHELRSFDTKIIFSHILNTTIGPVVRNNCLLFEGDKDISLDIANMILQKVGTIREPFIDTEILRGTPILLNKPIDVQAIYECILQIVKSNGLIELKNGNEVQIQKEADAWAEGYASSRVDGRPIHIQEVEAEHQVSCPPALTASEYIVVNGEKHKFVRRCGNPNCKVEINNFIPKGYRCKSCGQIYLGC